MITPQKEVRPVIRLAFGAHRFQGLSGGVMSVVELSRRPQPGARRSAPRAGRLAVQCQMFGPGRNDWDRGLRALRRLVLADCTLVRLADGAIALRGLPSGELRLDGAEVTRIRARGLHIAAGSFEAEIEAESFEAALASLGAAGTVIPFAARAR